MEKTGRAVHVLSFLRCFLPEQTAPLQPPLCNGPGRLLLPFGQFTFGEVARRSRDGGVDRTRAVTIPQSASLTAPFTQGSLGRSRASATNPGFPACWLMPVNTKDYITVSVPEQWPEQAENFLLIPN